MDWTTLIVAIVGSSALSTAIASLVGRFARDRDKLHYEILVQESDLLDKITMQAQDSNSLEIKSSRTLLKALVAAGHNQKIVRALIDRGRFGSLTLYFIAVLALAIGLTLLISVTLAPVVESNATVGKPADQMWIGFIAVLGGLLLIFVNLVEAQCKGQLRANLLAAIGGEFPEERRAFRKPRQPRTPKNPFWAMRPTTVQETNKWSRQLSLWVKLWVGPEIRMTYGSLMVQLEKARET